MSRTDNTFKHTVMILAFVIILQASFITYMFANYKNGFHSDESWSYGFANSYYVPYLYKEGNSNPHTVEKLTNFGQWLPGDVFFDYLAVNNGERFAYASVYYNKMYDQSPPLYCMLLHTICSFFPETFSWWFGFAINITMFVLIQILLFILGYGISRSHRLSLFVCAFYGFTVAALGTVVYLRMYALMTFFAMLYLVLLQRMYQKGFKKIKKECIALVICIALGGFTQYFFYIFAFFMTAFLCFYLLIIKKWKSLFQYAGISLLGACSGVLLYPTCIQVITDSKGMYSYSIDLPFWYDVEFCLDVLSLNTLGMEWRIDRFVIAEWLLYLVVVIGFAALVFFLFRKETWFFGIYDRVQRNAAYLKNNGKRLFAEGMKKINWFLVGMIVTLFATLTVISRVINVWGMKSWSDRYLFFLMPLFVLSVIYGMYLFLNLLFRRLFCIIQKKNVQTTPFVYGILFVMALLVLLIPGQIGRSHYLFKEYDTDHLTDLTADADCILVCNSDWALEWYCAELYKAANVYIVYTADVTGMMQNINTHAPEGRDTYLVLAQDSFNRILSGDETDGASAWLSKTSVNMTMQEYLELFLNAYLYADDAEYLYDQLSISGKLSVYRLY